MSLLIAGCRFSRIASPNRSSFWSIESPTVRRMGLCELEDVVDGWLGCVGRQRWLPGLRV